MTIPVGRPERGQDLGIGGRMGSENQGMNYTKAYDGDLLSMARRWYGYGRWDAPFWFIGPEPGMPASEKNDLKPRCKAWLRLGGGDLIDCKEHHLAFGCDTWHKQKPPTQATWRQLIRLLLAYRNGPPDTEDIRSYQQNSWGMKGGETCVIELCSLAANKLKVRKGVDFDANFFRQGRIQEIRERVRSYKPAFVVMYGKKDKLSWEAIADVTFSACPEIRTVGNGPTQAVFADHPAGYVGVSSSYWLQLAKSLRKR